MFFRTHLFPPTVKLCLHYFLFYIKDCNGRLEFICSEEGEVCVSWKLHDLLEMCFSSFRLGDVEYVDESGKVCVIISKSLLYVSGRPH